MKGNAEVINVLNQLIDGDGPILTSWRNVR